MKLSQMNLGQRIAKAVRDFEQLGMHRVRQWVVVLLNEDTVVIAVHGSLSASESMLASKPAGFARVTESNRRLYANTPLLQKLRSITGMGILDTAVELDSATGGVVLLFTTDTAGTDFPLFGRPERSRTPRKGLEPATRWRHPPPHQTNRIVHPV